MAASLARALRATGGWKVLREWRPRALTASTPHLVFSPRTLWSSTVRRSSADKEEQPPSSAGAESPKEPQEQSRPPPRYTDQGGEESEDYESEEALQHRILTAALQYVPEYGWSAEAIAAGAQSLDLSSAAAGMFEGGGSELVLHFVSECNARLSELMEEEHTLVQLGSAEKKPVARFLENVLEARLRMQIPYIGQWPQALGLLLFPQNIPSSLKLLTAMVDDIWHYAGDQSTDVSWYTRRAVLAGIYNTTELVMLQDSSPEFEDTWTFLHNRISEATAMGTSVKQVTSTGEAVVQGLLGAAVTLKNLTGLNQRR